MLRRKDKFELPTARDREHAFPELAAFYRTVEVSHGRFFIDGLFQRKFNDAAPDYPRHFVSFYRAGEGVYRPVNYLHALPYGPVMLIGGGATDGDAVRSMDTTHRESIMAKGGCLFIGLRAVFALLGDECEAFFGHVNNERAYEVDIKAGFRETGYENLVAYFPRPVTQRRKRELTEAVLRVGDF